MAAQFRNSQQAIAFAEELPQRAYLYGNQDYLLVTRRKTNRRGVQLLEIFHKRKARL